MNYYVKKRHSYDNSWLYLYFKTIEHILNSNEIFKMWQHLLTAHEVVI